MWEKRNGTRCSDDLNSNEAKSMDTENAEKGAMQTYKMHKHRMR